MTSRTWRLVTFGTVTLTAPDGTVRGCEGKPLAVLAYVAVEGRVPRSRLAGLLWPDRTERAARNNLVQLLRRMERSLGNVIVAAHDTLMLSPAVSADVQELLQHGGAVPAGHFVEGGDFGEWPELAEWLAVQREHFSQRRAQQLQQFAHDLEAQGQLTEAAVVAGQLLTLEPYSEDAHRRVMRLHYLAGRPQDALAAYRQLLATLQELKTTPLPETAQLARLIEKGEQLPADVPALPPALPELRVALAGRAREWRALGDAWQRGQFIIVSGEGGLGKSRLALEFAQSKGRVLALEGRPGDHLAPYTAAARNLRRVLARSDREWPEWVRRALSWLLPELALPGEAPADRADPRLNEAIQQVFGTGLTDVDVCLFDDIQYVDRATIEAGFMLIDTMFPLGQPGGLPHFIAVARRHELPPFTHALYEDMVRAGQAAWIDLTPLDDSAAREMLTELNVPRAVERAAELNRATGGNPLYLLEIARALLTAPPQETLELPGHASDLIARRVTRLPQPTLQVARACAVLQQNLSPELAAQVLGAPLLDVVAAWEDLEREQVLLGERFVHDLVAEAVLGSMPAVLRRVLHRSAARTLAAQDAAPGRVAQHWLDGEQPAEAVPWLLRAAEAAGAALRVVEAADLYGRAARLLQAQGAPAFAAWVRRAQVLAASSDRDARQAAINTVLEEASTPAEEARAWQLQAELYVSCHQGERAETAARRGLALADASPDVTLRGTLLTDLGAALWTQGRVADAVPPLEQAVALLDTQGDSPELASALSSLAAALDHQDRHRDALSHHRRACALLERFGPRDTLLVALRNWSVCLCDLGRVREGLDALQRAQALDEGSSTLWSSSIGHALIAMAHTDLSEYALALDSWARARAAQDLSGWLPAYYAACEAELWLTVNVPERAAPLLEEARTTADLPATYRARVLVSEARLAVTRGAAVREAFAPAHAAALDSGRPLARVRAAVAHAAALPAAEALPHARDARTLARAHELPGYELSAGLLIIRSLLALHRADEAWQEVLSVRDLLSDAEPADLTRGDALLILAAAHDARLDPGAGHWRRLAREWVEHVSTHHVPPVAATAFRARFGVAAHA